MMKIGDIKNLSEDARVKFFFHFFWDFEIPGIVDDIPIAIYRRELQKLPDGSTIDEVYTIIRNVFVQYGEYFRDEGKIVYGNQTRYISELSRRLYNYSKYWKNMSLSEVTDVELRKEERKKELEAVKARMEKMSFLYEVFGLSKNPQKPNKDVVKEIAGVEQLSEEIVERKEEIIENNALFYELCERHILPAANTDSWNYTFGRIMKNVSRMVYQDKDYWLKKNQFDVDAFITERVLKKID